jgi:phospholipase/carboxylesterase
MLMLETIEIETGSSPTAAVIWLHGLGADGHDFEPVVPHLVWPGAPEIRFIFPHAPVRPVTVNGGMRMRAWYDIVSIDSDRNHDEAGIRESMAQTQELVQQQIDRGISPGRIIVAGFSQGGAIAIQVALRQTEALAGLMALSTYMLLAEKLDNEAGVVAELPVFMGHGQMDPVVPFEMGEKAAKILRNMGCDVQWQAYPIQHSVSMDEIVDISAWLKQRLA